MPEKKDFKKIKEYTYFVRGMHCASCEILIEKKLLEIKNIQSVDASTSSQQVTIEYHKDKPSASQLNKLFRNQNYIFSEQFPPKPQSNPIFRFNNQGLLLINKEKLNNLLTVAGISLTVIGVFLLLNRSGLSALISVNSSSALPAFFVFGLLAGFSSCSALVGGIILSMSKQWSELFPGQSSAIKRIQPHLLFNIGRLASYFLLGALLGILGNVLQISLTLTSILTILVSLLMIFLGLQMLGVRAFAKARISTPKFITRFIADENNFKGQAMPLLMGALTFFLPCGFTITAQGLALTSGKPYQAAMIMLFFALGTLPALLLISFSSVKFTKKKHFAGQFLKIAGVLVLFFGIFNINSQLNVLGFDSLSDLRISAGSQQNQDGFPPIINGKQILKTTASAYAYEPPVSKVEAGIPVRWEITDEGTSGCTNAIISKGLFDGQIDLSPCQTSIKEFTPATPGRYKFSCWMGMVSGTIEVIDPSAGQQKVSQNYPQQEVSSGAAGCGCGGGNR